MDNTISTIQITDDFIGVLVNGKRAGQVIRRDRWYIAQTPQFDDAVFGNPNAAVDWIAHQAS